MSKLECKLDGQLLHLESEEYREYAEEFNRAALVSARLGYEKKKLKEQQSSKSCKMQTSRRNSRLTHRA